MLRVEGLCAGYHGGRVLHDVDLVVAAGTVHAVVGRNGAGKTTLVHAIAGLLRPYTGAVLVGDLDVTRLPAHRVARAGVGLVPQGRRVFASLTVAEHLTLAAATHRGGRNGGTPAGGAPWTVARVLAEMPRLAERLRHRGDQLSGGEQQMLAIGRALLTQPGVLLLDEPCEGLAGDLATRIGEIVAGLAGTGMSVLLVEQQLDRAIAVSDEITVLDYGRVAHRGSTADVRADPRPLETMLSVAHAAPDLVGTGGPHHSGSHHPGSHHAASHRAGPHLPGTHHPAPHRPGTFHPAPHHTGTHHSAPLSPGHDDPAPSSRPELPAPSPRHERPAPSPRHERPAPSSRHERPAPSSRPEDPAPETRHDTPAPSPRQEDPAPATRHETAPR